MPRATFFLICCLLACSSFVSAQRVLRRDGLLSLDSKPFLTYEVTNVYGNKIFNYHALGGEETLFLGHECSNWTTTGGDEYFHYYFPEQGLELILPNKRKYRFKYMLPLMLEEGVLDEDGNLDADALPAFIAKYHVPLPKSFGPKVHRQPMIGADKKSSHLWEFSKDYDPVKREWKNKPN